jgi:hypothetical protein
VFLYATLCAGQTQTNDANQTQTNDMDSQIEAVRSDIRSDKTKLITEAMNFSDSESKIFWPVYHKYEEDLRKLNDQRVALIKSYAEKYSSMTDHDAKSILDQGLDFDLKRSELKKKYAKEFQKAGLSSLTTAKFFQLEHRLDALIDLKLASELPSLLARGKPADK